MRKRVYRKNVIRPVARITDRADGNDVAAGLAQRAGEILASTVIEATVSVGAARESLIAVLDGGARERPERMLSRAAEHIYGLRVYGHTRHDGRTYVSIVCPSGSLPSLRALTFVVGIQVAAPDVCRGAGAGDAPRANRTFARQMASSAAPVARII